MTMCFDLTETDSERDWSYLSEGGASVLLAYVGKQHSVCSGKVLRIRKTLALHLSDSRFPETPNTFENQQDDEDPSVVFQKLVISQLLPEQYLPDMQSVGVTKEWLFKLAEAIEPFRPDARKRQGQSIDTSRKVAALATNLVDGGLSVEIKPKWGFLPAPDLLSPATLPFKTRYCRFCMHRYYKHLDASHFDEAFCPLNLFSGDKGRIRRYLHGLWTSWLSTDGQINNLRIFHDGKLIKSATNMTHGDVSKLLLCTEEADISDIGSALVERLLVRILETDLFEIICRLQKTLDPLDIEGLTRLWSLFHPGSVLGYGEPEPSIAEWKEFVELYRKRGEFTLRQSLLAYLLSATFKDCSVIIGGLDEEKKRKISVIDVGPKSIQRLRKWKELDDNILSHFMRLSESGPKTPCLQ